MKDLWKRLKRFCNGQDRIDQMNRGLEQCMEWHREDVERARNQARAELRYRFAVEIVGALMTRLPPDNNVTLEMCKIVWKLSDMMLETRDNA